MTIIFQFPCKPSTVKEEDMFRCSKKKMKEVSNSSSVDRMDLEAPVTNPKKPSFVETLKKSGVEVSRGVSFKGHVLLDFDKVSISPPT